MKKTFPIALALVCVGLAVALFLTKRGDDAQHDSDTASITEFSNTLAAAQSQVVSCNGAILVLSNSLDQSQSAALAVSNELAGAQSAIASGQEQITNLDRQVAAAKSENQALNQSLTDLTSQTTAQITSLTNQVVLAKAELNQTRKDYALLENRLRRDVAERMVVERKFSNSLELQKRLQYLKTNPAVVISEQSIYAGLDVEVKSNAVHVIAPD
ncbi:MAG TPA: hypothetical protein VGI63_01010 [Verrucomicrobiae bacterium]